MPTYIVTDTHIRHGEGKVVRVYAPGDEIELSEEQAARLAHHLELKAEEEKPAGYEEMTVARLQETLRERGVEVLPKAKKADLVALLEETEKGEAPPPPEEG